MIGTPHSTLLFMRTFFPFLPAALLGAAFLLGAARVQAMNNDGQPDLLWRHSSTGANEVWALNGPAYSGTLALNSVDTSWKMVGTADFNADGQLDIAWYQPSTGHVAYWYMNGTTRVSSIDLINANPPLYQTSPADWVLAGVGYFGGAGDKKPDLLWVSPTTDELAVWHMDNTAFLSAAYLQNSGGVHVRAPLPWRFAAAADFNGDGHTDVILRDTAYGQNGVWLLAGTTYSSSLLLTSVEDTGWEIVGANHFNGDTSLDLAWQHRTLGYVVLWLMNGSSFGSWADLGTRPLAWRIGGTGDSRLDWDADGLPDLWERNHFGSLTQGAYGDYDGDGMTNLQEYQNGTSPVSRDTDGDGLIDCVFDVMISRPKNTSSLP